MAAEHATVFDRYQLFQQERLAAQAARRSLVWKGCCHEVGGNRTGRGGRRIETGLASKDLDTDLDTGIADETCLTGNELANLTRRLTKGASQISAQASLSAKRHQMDAIRRDRSGPQRSQGPFVNGSLDVLSRSCAR